MQESTRKRAAERSSRYLLTSELLQLLLGGMEETRRRLSSVYFRLDAEELGEEERDLLEEIVEQLVDKIRSANSTRSLEAVDDRNARWARIAELRASLGMSKADASHQALHSTPLHSTPLHSTPLRFLL